jgi:hypothetical protein
MLQVESYAVYARVVPHGLELHQPAAFCECVQGSMIWNGFIEASAQIVGCLILPRCTSCWHMARRVGTWHVVLAHGTSCWHMARRVGTWHVVLAHGTSCWHMAC